MSQQRPVFDQVVDVPYTANFSDAFYGVERLRLANEGAIRVNIGAFLQRIAALSSPPGSKATPAVVASSPGPAFSPNPTALPQTAAVSQIAIAPPPSQVMAARPASVGGLTGRYAGRLNLVAGNCGSGGERMLIVNGSDAEMLIYPVSGLMLRGTADAEGHIALESIPGVQSMTLRGKITDGTFYGQTSDNACVYEMTMKKR